MGITIHRHVSKMKYTKAQKFRNVMEQLSHPYHWPDDHWYFENNQESLNLKHEFEALTQAEKDNIIKNTKYPLR